jgi:hypothetical protein
MGIRTTIKAYVKRIHCENLDKCDEVGNNVFYLEIAHTHEGVS